MMLVVALTAVCTTTVSGNLLPELQQLNYGVVFEPTAKLQLSEETWIHTFEIELTTSPNMTDLPACTKGKQICKTVNDVLLEISQIRHETELIINSTLESVYELIPEGQLSVRSRSKRAILSFIGDFSKSIFGTVTINSFPVPAPITQHS